MRHAKRNNVPDWTQQQLNDIISGGRAPLPPAGTLLSDVTLHSDWNDYHVKDVSTQSGTTYTLAITDYGNTVRFTNSSAITVTLPNNLPVGFYTDIIQSGAGQITFSAGSGASFNSAHSYTKTYGQYAMVGLQVDTNSNGTSAHYILVGDGA